MKIVERFRTIQGEGRYVGIPVHLIRLHGCNLDCEWCDTPQRKGEYIEEASYDVARTLQGNTILWTGGEPCLQLDEICEVISMSWGRKHHLETNGTILSPKLKRFDYISFSPKTVEAAKRCMEFGLENLVSTDGKPFAKFDIKVVTDMQNVGLDIIQFATVLMPLTTGHEKKDLHIKQRVWDFCANNDKRYSPRIHIGVEQFDV